MLESVSYDRIRNLPPVTQKRAVKGNNTMANDYRLDFFVFDLSLLWKVGGVDDG